MKSLLLIGFLFVLSLTVSAQVKPYPQPDFSGVTMDGEKVSLSELRGKVVVINLWFINCPNCLAEIKELNQLVARYRDNKEVVFLAPAASTRAQLVTFLKKTPFSYQVMPDSSIMIIQKFGTPGKNGTVNIPFPMHYVLDREGNVRVRVAGTKGIEAVRDELKSQFRSKSD